ncbi:MAG TPA: glycosyltransferase family 2 protein, partial [Kofleriaceae bacterium]|nr:glycosyltransferase family 2 protein [Kofleriaceae bacterium]
MITHLFVYPGAAVPSSLPEDVRASQLPASPAAAAAAIDDVLADERVTTLACWDVRLAPVPWLHLARFATSLDDAWHPGAGLSGLEDDLLRYVLPTWVNRPVPDAALAGAINWRLDLRACFVRASAVRALGGLDGQFETLAGAARELGLRMIRRGAICRQQPVLWSGDAVPEPPSAADRYRLLVKRVSRKWPAYALVRSVIDGRSLVDEARAWRAALADRPLPPAPVGALARPVDHVALPTRPTVTVVLPKFGRYKYLAEVLEDLRAQTIPPTQIVIADGNPADERDLAMYERFQDLPIELVWDEERGMCAARNACLRRATGEYVWFVDDDSRFPADNLEQHLRVLAAYG